MKNRHGQMDLDLYIKDLQERIRELEFDNKKLRDNYIRVVNNWEAYMEKETKNEQGK